MRYAVAALFALALAGYLIWAPSTGAERQTGISMEGFEEVLERIEADYVEDLDRRQLLEAAVQGMVSELDAHSAYLSHEDFENFRVQTDGEYGGLGLRVTPQDDGLIRVVSPIDGSPAANTRIQPGDLIVQVGDTPAGELAFAEAIQRMRGEPGTRIRLTLRRDPDLTYQVELERARVTVDPVHAARLGRIGYVRIASFNARTADALDDALDRLRGRSDAPLQGLVLDLRNNPGGLLTEAVDVADAFLGESAVVRVQAADGQTKVYRAKAGQRLDGVAMAVLINGGSASGSEIVAGALKDHGRAAILGTRSFGKGSVQTVRRLSNGGALRLTTARYLTPSGDSIADTGVTPDIEVARDADGQATGDGDGQPAGDGESQASRPVRDPAEAPDPATDRQLARALELLRNGELDGGGLDGAGSNDGGQ